MNDLKLLGLQEVDGIKFNGIEGGFGEKSKCMLVKDIANIHNKESKYINKLVNNNRRRFKDKIDLIDIKGTEFEVLLMNHEVFTQNALNRSDNIYLLSERGYAKLLKLLEDDTAWEQYDKLVDGYFSMRQELRNSIPKSYAEALFEAGRLQLALEEASKQANKYGVFLETSGTYSFEEVAKMISTRSKNEGIDTQMSVIALTRLLREHEILCKDKTIHGFKNMPRKDYEQYFNTTSIHIIDNDGGGFDKTTTRVKATGIDMIYDFIKNAKRKDLQLV